LAQDRRNARGVERGVGMDVEGVGKAHEEVEERTIVNGFGDLRVRPASLTQPLDLLVGDAIRVAGERFDEFQEKSVLRCEAGGVEVSITKSRGRLRVLFTLQLQEPGMAAESIVAAVQRRDVRRDHFVLGPGQRAIGEVHPARLVDGTQEVGS